MVARVAMQVFCSEREAREYAERIDDLNRRVEHLQVRIDSTKNYPWDVDSPHFVEMVEYGQTELQAKFQKKESAMHNRIKDVAAGVSCFLCFTWALTTTVYVLNNDNNFTQTVFFKYVLPGLVGFLVSQIILYVASYRANMPSKVKAAIKERDAALHKLHRIGLAVEQERVQGYRDNAGSCDGIIVEIKEILK